MAEVELGNLYDMNKQLSHQMPVLNEVEKAAKFDKIKDWFRGQTYVMLLCHEQRDFTLFNNTSLNESSFGEATSILFECIENRGELVSMDPVSNDPNSWEIWIRIDDEDFCYYLFNYDLGVIEV